MSIEQPGSPPIEPQATRAGRRRWVPIVLALLFLSLSAVLFVWLSRVSPLDEARKAVAAGEVNQANRYFNDYLRAQPDDWKVRLEYGTFLKQHDAAAALRLLEEIPKTAPEFIPAARQIAHIALVGERNAIAESALRQLYADNPNDVETLLALAHLYRRQDKNAEAIPFAEKAAKLKPDQIENQLFLAQVYFSVGRGTEMAEPLQKALQLDPENREAHLNLAFSYTQSNELDKARQEAEWSRRHEPGNVQVWRVLSNIEWVDGNHEKALEYARKGLELDPNELECRILEGQILVFQRKFQEAYDRMLPIYERSPREQRVVGVLAQATRALGKKEEAEKFQKLAIELGNENYQGEKKSGK